jgi:hypothetical protein
LASKIEKAAKATSEIQDLVGEALKLLKAFDGRIINGAGVYVDPMKQRNALRSARHTIETALALMIATTWPNDSDYD